nr:immunoglobulin light chain junction region [Macaca mulatta]
DYFCSSYASTSTYYIF